MIKKKLNTRRSIALKDLAGQLSPEETLQLPLAQFVREAWLFFFSFDSY